jgi:Muniscin C-terminal mu homology domain
LFKTVKDQDEDDTPSPSKIIAVAIKKEAIVDDEKVSLDVMNSVSTQLQKDRIRVNSEPISGSVKTPVPYASSLPPLTASSSIDDIQSTFYITEKINAYIHEGTLQNSLITGELGLNLFSLPSSNLNFDTTGLQNVTINNQFLQDDFKFNLDSLKTLQGSSIVLVKYQVEYEIPMIIPVFKVDKESISILIDIKSDLKLDYVRLMVSFEGDGEVGRVESLPIAQWDLDAKVLVWEVESGCERVVGRIEGSGLVPRPVMVEFEGGVTKGVVDGEMKVVNGMFTTVGRVFKV